VTSELIVECRLFDLPELFEEGWWHTATVAARIALSGGPPRRSRRAELPHPALTSGVWQRSLKVDLVLFPSHAGDSRCCHSEHPTNPIPASLVSLVAGAFRSRIFFPSRVVVRSEQWWRRLPAAQPSATRASRPPAAIAPPYPPAPSQQNNRRTPFSTDVVRPLDDFCWCSCWQCGRDARVPASHRGSPPACQSQTRRPQAPSRLRPCTRTTR
jgi:hypothetical protein